MSLIIYPSTKSQGEFISNMYRLLNQQKNQLIMITKYWLPISTASASPSDLHSFITYVDSNLLIYLVSNKDVEISTSFVFNSNNVMT